MRIRMDFSLLYLLLSFLASPAVAADSTPQPQVPLVLPAGIPLRLYLTARVPKRAGAPVEAKLLDPVYAFDRQVIPAGTVVLGRVVEVKPVSKGERTRAILNGDFTPLHIAPVEFTTVVMPDGHRLPLMTAASLGLDSIVPSRKPKKQSADPAQNTGVVATAKQQARDAIQSKIDQVKSIPDLVRGPGKKDLVEDYLVSKLPYHPQYIRKGTRFDAELTEPLSFGYEPVPPGSLDEAGAQPPPGSVAKARLITPLDSRSSKQGETVKAVLAEPVYSPDHKLILPEGTLVEGTVVEVKPARWLHRAGQLRFTFKELELPEEVARLKETARLVSSAAPRPVQEELKVRTEANLQSAESSTKTPLKVDAEGGVQAKEPKTRFLAAAAAVMIARSAGDNDPIRNQSHQIIGQSQNVGGRTVGGGFGFGLLGVGIAQSSRWVGAAFGYYGMAWSLFSTVISRGGEVQFGKDAMVEIRFDTRSGLPAAPNGATK
jgi:hypothetical protein